MEDYYDDYEEFLDAKKVRQVSNTSLIGQGIKYKGQFTEVEDKDKKLADISAMPPLEDDKAIKGEKEQKP